METAGTSGGRPAPGAAWRRRRDAHGVRWVDVAATAAVIRGLTFPQDFLDSLVAAA